MEELINKFLSIGYGDGDGSGSGDGSGYGSGSGDGYGDSSGYGSGDGYGSGSGSGDGSGSGSGDGSGSGSGSGYGLKKFGEHTVYLIDCIQTIIYNVHGNYAKGAIVNADLTLTPCFIAKEGDLFAHGMTLQEAVQAAQSKAIEEMPVERRIDKFLQVYSDKNEKHSGREFFNWHHILTGSCEMGRNQFCKDNDIEIDAEYTPVEFLNLCKDAYKGDVIKKVLLRYER